MHHQANGNTKEWNGQQPLEHFARIIARELRVTKEEGRSCSGSFSVFDGDFSKLRSFHWEANYICNGRWDIKGHEAGAVADEDFSLNTGVNRDMINFVQARLNDMRTRGEIFKPKLAAEDKPKSPLPPQPPHPPPPASPTASSLKPPAPPAPPPKPQPDSPKSKPEVQSTVDLRLDEIEPWPEQPRSFFKQKTLLELSDSMGGLQQVLPILVRPFKPGEARLNQKSKHQIVDGERRFRGAWLNRATTIRAIIVYPKDIVEQHRMSVIANLHREKHSHYELARAVIFQYEHGRNAQQIAADFSKKSAAWAYIYIALRDLQKSLFELMNPAVGREKQLPFQYARILAGVKLDRQTAILEQARKEGEKQGPRGILRRLEELAEENQSDTGQSGRQRRRDLDHAARTANRAIASTRNNAQILLEIAPRLMKSPAMKEPEARDLLVAQVRDAVKSLEEFADELLQK